MVKRVLSAVRRIIYPAYQKEAMQLPDFAVKKLILYLCGAGLCLAAAVWFLIAGYPSWIIFLLGIGIFALKALSLRNCFARGRVVAIRGYVKTVSPGGKLKPFQTIQVFKKPGSMAAEIAIDKRIRLAERGRYAFYFMQDSEKIGRAGYSVSAGNFIGYEPIITETVKKDKEELL